MQTWTARSQFFSTLIQLFLDEGKQIGCFSLFLVSVLAILLGNREGKEPCDQLFIQRAIIPWDNRPHSKITCRNCQRVHGSWVWPWYSRIKGQWLTCLLVLWLTFNDETADNSNGLDSGSSIGLLVRNRGANLLKANKPHDLRQGHFNTNRKPLLGFKHFFNA